MYNFSVWTYIIRLVLRASVIRGLNARGFHVRVRDLLFSPVEDRSCQCEVKFDLLSQLYCTILVYFRRIYR